MNSIFGMQRTTGDWFAQQEHLAPIPRGARRLTGDANDL